ncbi:MAG TPA: helix-turn-helix domain-containing protein [Chthoniobacter sp.]|nr:helix-turn-helix domain-containing protein [Chthoniobacter sp.]
MPTVAERLRGARENLGWTVTQMAESTKIKSDHIRALEEGRYEVFSAPVYIRGFTRTYSTALKLDVREVMHELDLELSRTERFREPPSLLGNNRGPVDAILYQLSRINWRIALPALAILLIGALALWGYRAWRDHAAADPLADLGPGLYHAPKQPGETIPFPTNPVVAPARKK